MSYPTTALHFAHTTRWSPYEGSWIRSPNSYDHPFSIIGHETWGGTTCEGSCVRSAFSCATSFHEKPMAPATYKQIWGTLRVQQPGAFLSWASLGLLLGFSWASLGLSWASLGFSWPLSIYFAKKHFWYQTFFKNCFLFKHFSKLFYKLFFKLFRAFDVLFCDELIRH